MLVTHGATRAGSRSAVTIGNFDGVHKGHQAMIAQVLDQARSRGLQACVLTFEPHPREFFERARRASPAAAVAPTRLTSLREKLELLASLGVERVHVERFSRRFASLAPQAFVSEVLVDRLRAGWVLVGGDFCFGAQRKGDIGLLKDLGARWSYELEVMAPVMHQGTRVSSGAVRDVLSRGDLAGAQALLGRPYGISGRVVQGDRLGRELGFPTANVNMKHNRPPLSGIFAVRLHGADALARMGVASLGVRPTVKSHGEVVLEVHLFDFSADIYARHVRVEFLHKIRDEEKYPDLESLRAQIARDCEAARSLLLEHGNA